MGRHSGWTENLAGFQEPFLTSLHALSDTKEGNIGVTWVWGVRNHTPETDAQVNTVDELQELACAAMEDKETMDDLTRINLPLSQILTQAHKTILVLSK